MKVQSTKDDTSFKTLYAPKDVQQHAEFIKAKDFLKIQAMHDDIYVKIIEEINEIGIPVKKFFVEVKDLFDSNITGKTKTKVLSAEQLAKATLGAVKIKMDKAEKLSKVKRKQNFAQMQDYLNKIWGNLFGTDKNPFDNFPLK